MDIIYFYKLHKLIKETGMYYLNLHPIDYQKVKYFLKLKSHLLPNIVF